MNSDSDRLRVKAEELDYASELFYTYKGMPFTGVTYEDEPGKWLSEVSYRDGLQDGVARDWYPSGGLKGESWYKENTLHGRSRDYSEDQVVISEKIYEYGILVRRAAWDDAGRQIDSWAIDAGGSVFGLLRRYRAEKQWPAVD